MKIKENLARNKIRGITLIIFVLALFLFPCEAKAVMNGDTTGNTENEASNEYVSWISNGNADSRFDEYNYHQGAGDPITNKALLDKLAELERVGGATVAPYLLQNTSGTFKRTVDPETGPAGL